MKRSNIYLGVTAFALAIAGAFSSKASNKVLFITGYSVPSPLTHVCGTQHTDLDCANVSGAVCQRDGITMYTKGSAAANSCVNKIKTAAN